MSIVFATTNPGKRLEVTRFLQAHGITIKTLPDFDRSFDTPAEDGSTLEENARAKAEGYVAQLPGHIILADDTGIEIDALGGEPGIKVRRWKDGRTEMTDQEIVDYAVERLADVPAGRRGAQARTVVAVAAPGKETRFFDGTLRGEIVTKALSLQMAGFPFESLFYVPEWKLMLGEIHQMASRADSKYLSHRQHAFANALPYLKEITS